MQKLSQKEVALCPLKKTQNLQKNGLKGFIKENHIGMVQEADLKRRKRPPITDPRHIRSEVGICK